MEKDVQIVQSEPVQTVVATLLTVAPFCLHVEWFSRSVFSELVPKHLFGRMRNPARRESLNFGHPVPNVAKARTYFAWQDGQHKVLQAVRTSLYWQMWGCARQCRALVNVVVGLEKEMAAGCSISFFVLEPGCSESDLKVKASGQNYKDKQSDLAVTQINESCGNLHPYLLHRNPSYVGFKVMFMTSTSPVDFGMLGHLDS